MQKSRAKVSKIPNGIEITGGKGIGKVTKAGLDQPIGEAAINSVPRKMIAAAVNEAAEKHDYHGGFHIEISVPNGEETEEKTEKKTETEEQEEKIEEYKNSVFWSYDLKNYRKSNWWCKTASTSIKDSITIRTANTMKKQKIKEH